MKQVTKLIVCLSGIMALASCDGDRFFGPYDLEKLTLELKVMESGPDQTTISGGMGTILIRSLFSIPMCGYELSGSLSQGPSGLEVLVEAHFVGGLAVACDYPYEAVVSVLPTGRHTITLVHQVDGGIAAPVAQAMVKVP